MLNKTVEIKKYGQDTYGRALGVVFLSGKNVNSKWSTPDMPRSTGGNRLWRV
jgi:hypothetical protein